jgi:hypothetical protein
MTRKRKTATRATPARRPRKQRGSTMLMVVVILFMLAIMGTAYLQYARIQRFAAGSADGDIDTVIKAAVAQIKGQLNTDITYGPDFAPYDYPWTNQTLPATPRNATRFDGTQVPVPGGKGDDYWLAGTSPIFGTTTSWNHISNITGLYLRWNNSTGEFLDSSNVAIVPGALPEQDIVDFSNNTFNTDTDLDIPTVAFTPPVTVPWTLADSDGDGIPDSRWTWAPIRQINGVTYVMAVRVVDLSSLINVNTGLSTIDVSGAFDTSAPGTNAPHWDTPGEVDLGRFVHTIAPALMATEFEQMLFARSAASTIPAGLASPMPWDARKDFWRNVGRYYPRTTNPTLPLPATLLYGVDDEYNLRRFNGINDSAKTPGPLEITTPPITGLPTFLQSTDPQTPLASPTQAQIKEHFGADIATPANNRRRPSVSVFGGAMTLATPIPTNLIPPYTFAATPVFKLDLNKASVTDIATRIHDVYSFNPSTTTLPGGFPAANITDFADRLAANIATYRRNDNKIVQSGSQYGLAPLPFISEVYSQRYYTPTSVENPPASNLFDVTWTATSDAGFAIELSNPFTFPIKLDNVHLWINGVDQGLLTALAPSITQIDPGQPVLLYKNSGDTGGNQNIQSTYFATLGATRVAALGSVTWPNDAAGTFEIQLRATRDDNSAIAAPYQKVTTNKQPDSYVQNNVPGPAPAVPGYRQYATLGNGLGLNILNVTAAEFRQGINDPTSPYKTSSGDLVALGTTDKNTLVAGAPTSHIPSIDLDKMQIIIAQQDLLHVGELMHIANLGQTDTQTIAEVWAASPDVDDFLLKFDPDPPTTAPLMDSASPDLTSHYHVPHAQFLIDQFTTLDPNSDTIDNDGKDAIDDGNERIIPGLVNLNTMPEQLLEQALPIPDSTVRSNVAKAIVAYRTAANRPANARQNTIKGIANTGEITGLIDATGPSLISDVLGIDTIDNPTIAGVKIDFLSNGATSLADGIKDDREEKSAIARWLSQVGSVRSDHFIAYIWVRGYRSTDMTSAGLLETKRAMVVFRRNIASGAISVEAVLPSGKSFVENR